MMRNRRGLTLLEILIALIVMVVGVVGILALFPPALESAKDSMQKTQGAILAESVANALSNSAKFATPLPTGEYEMLVTHDSRTTGGTPVVYYKFKLPKLTDPGWKHHPGDTAASSFDTDPYWLLVGDEQTVRQHGAIKGQPGDPTAGTDKSDPLDQFGYSFDVRKVNTLEYLKGQPKPGGGVWDDLSLDPLVKVWEFRIHTFRIKGDTSVPPEWIATLSTRITVR